MSTNHILTQILLIAGLVSVLSLVLNADGTAQQPPPCSAPEASQFDFWVGMWNATWDDTGKGTNHITKELDGCVIHEHFATLDSVPFVGRSYSVYNINTQQWHQTWVDNSGGYLDFTGGMVGDKMILSRTAHPKGKEPFMQRMVFSNIKSDSFDWDWQKSTDGGDTWVDLWHIHYTRAK